MDIFRLKNEVELNLNDLWEYIELFNTAMSLNIFLFILRWLRYDDIKDRYQRKAQDKLALMKELFTKFIINIQKAYSVSEYWTIDVQLLPLEECAHLNSWRKT